MERRRPMIFCVNCGNQLPDDAAFCNKCGSRSGKAVHTTDGGTVHAKAPATPESQLQSSEISAAATASSQAAAASSYGAPPGRKKRGGFRKALIRIGAVLGALILIFVVLAIVFGGDPGGRITTGEAKIVGNAGISVSGGIVTVSDASSSVSGMKILVPDGALIKPVDFVIKESPIESHTFGSDFNPLTPVITIENGGLFAEKALEVTIPIKIQEGRFPMAFYYDDEAGSLEGIPTLAVEDGSIVIAARHFSDIVVTDIDVKELENVSVNSGFVPGNDDWQFANRGSSLEPGGHCAGQSISAIWYYSQMRKAQGEKALNGRFDNNLNDVKTKDFWYDDSDGYRLASMVQNTMDWKNEGVHKYFAFSGEKSYITYHCFAYSIKMSGSPQLILVYSEDHQEGHAMIVYKIKDNTMFIADPNFPGDTSRKIAYDYEKGLFSPYFSGDNATKIKEGTGRITRTSIIMRTAR